MLAQISHSLAIVSFLCSRECFMQVRHSEAQSKHGLTQLSFGTLVSAFALSVVVNVVATVRTPKLRARTATKRRVMSRSVGKSGSGRRRSELPRRAAVPTRPQRRYNRLLLHDPCRHSNHTLRIMMVSGWPSIFTAAV